MRNAMLANGANQPILIRNIPFAKSGLRDDIFVKNNLQPLCILLDVVQKNGMPACEQILDNPRAKKSITACDKNSHSATNLE
jgi:hypothetical protein